MRQMIDALIWAVEFLSGRVDAGDIDGFQVDGVFEQRQQVIVTQRLSTIEIGQIETTDEDVLQAVQRNGAIVDAQVFQTRAAP